MQLFLLFFFTYWYSCSRTADVLWVFSILPITKHKEEGWIVGSRHIYTPSIIFTFFLLTPQTFSHLSQISCGGNSIRTGKNNSLFGIWWYVIYWKSFKFKFFLSIYFLTNVNFCFCYLSKTPTNTLVFSLSSCANVVFMLSLQKPKEKRKYFTAVHLSLYLQHSFINIKT